MADSLTLAQIKTRVRERADMVGSSFVSDSELTGYIDYSYKELYDLLTEACEDYNVSSANFTITSGNTSTLPADFYKLKGVDDLTDPNTPRTVKKFNWNERNDFGEVLKLQSAYDFSDVFYRVQGSNLVFTPPENAFKSYRLWYVPLPNTLSLDADVASGVQGWLEYVIVDAAIKCRTKEESDITALQTMKGGLIERIGRLRHNRDQSLPEKVSRVRNRFRNRLISNIDGFI